jgi:hypothetical protein
MLLEREIEQRIELEQQLEKVSHQYQESLKQCETLRDKVRQLESDKKCETLDANIDSIKPHIDCETFNQAIEVLEDALLMKANAGGAIKIAIRSAITLLKSDN